MRTTRLLPLLLLSLTSCRSGTTEVEAGAILLELKCARAGQVPDELRVWAYDDTGRLWDGTRVPADGRLVPKSARELGSILIQPGALSGKLRIHVRGLALGTRILDGTLIATPTQENRTFDLVLEPAIPADGDRDGVPDVIDDCARVANPQQGGCKDAGMIESPDAPFDVPTVTTDGRPDAGPGSDGKDGEPSSLEDAPASTDVPGDVRGVADADAGPPVTSDTADSPTDNRASPDVAGADVGQDLNRDTSEVSGDVQADRADAVLPPDLGRDLGADSSTGRADAEAGCGDLGRCNLSQGALCRLGAECASGVCADGVCCTSACEGPCRSCNQPSAMGTCQAYAAGTNPESGCLNGATCNGAGACGAPPPPNLPNGQMCTSDTQCASGSCVDGKCCNSKCAEPCYSCETGRCLTVHNTEDVPQCSGGHTCDKRGNCI